jgi:cell division septation protein DedD
MLKAKICVLVVACAFGANAMAAEKPDSTKPPYRPSTGPWGPIIHATQPQPATKPPYRPSAEPKPHGWSMVISAPRS